MRDDPISYFDAILKPVGGIALLLVLFKYMPVGPAPGKVLIWAVACAVTSGAIWTALVHLSQKGRFPILRRSTGMFGGNGKEPNGPESLILTLVMFGPLTLAAVHLTSAHRDEYPLSAFIGYLVGTAVGMFGFYGGRVREHVLELKYGYLKRETWLAFWWAVLLAIPGFVGFHTGLLIAGGLAAQNVQLLATQILLVVSIVWSTITGFVALVRGDEHENVRGMWAGAFLVLASLSALLVRAPADLFAWISDVLNPL